MEAIRVATWNTLSRDRMHRIGLAAAQLRAVDPDVILLQETAEGHARTLADELGLVLAALDHVDSAEVATAVLTRPDLQPHQPPKGLDGVAGRAMVATVDLSFGDRRLRTTSAHLRNTPSAGRLGFDPDYRAAASDAAAVESIADESIRTSVLARLHQLGQLKNARRQLTIEGEVFGGDLNFVPCGIEYRRVKSWGLADAWTAAPRIGSGATILERNPLVIDSSAHREAAVRAYPGISRDLDYTLDFQFHSPSLIAGAAWVFGEPIDGDSWASDHLGIAVDYAWRN
ncbi:endonuclease/exonuclease/phosphatase family protein [Saccharopolyspora sp. NPDC050389]|uniref:endonuclease/exonuclease/phosphatase family protein n=1 Tax=Saccharopolyspora sp. NPDC050389 TaxID=3155516 RepID=UPI0033E62A2F